MTSMSYRETGYQQAKLNYRTGQVLDHGFHVGWIFCQAMEGQPFLVAPHDTSIVSDIGPQPHAKANYADVPTIKELQTMYENRAQGALKDTFTLQDSWAGSSTRGEAWFVSSDSARSAGEFGYPKKCLSFVDGSVHGSEFGNHTRLIRRLNSYSCI